MCDSSGLLRGQWFTASHSTGSHGSVEVALAPDAVGVRDSEDRDGGTLVFTPHHWKTFIAALKDEPSRTATTRPEGPAPS